MNYSYLYQWAKKQAAEKIYAEFHFIKFKKVKTEQHAVDLKNL